MTLAIQTVALTKRYGKSLVVDGLSLRVPAGVVCGLVGPNGAGKTTTIRMLLGLVHPTSGTAAVCGLDTIRDRASVVRRIGAVVEAPAFYDYLTATQNLHVLSRTSGVRLSAARVEQLLDFVGLEAPNTRPVKTYSHGMKQRLGIAAALVADPDILILDEPSNGLDPAGIVELRHLLSNLRDAGKTVLVSSHLLTEVERTCDRLVVLHHGHILAEGEASSFQSARALSADVDRPADLASSIRRAVDVPVTVSGQAISLHCTREQLQYVRNVLDAAGVSADRVTVRDASFESYFLALVGAARGEGRHHGC